MASIVDLRSGRATGPIWNVALDTMNLYPRWRPDGNGFVIVQGRREMNLQESDLTEPANDRGWLVGKTIGLAKPADRYMHAYPAYCPAGKFIAFSLSPIYYLVREAKGAQGLELKEMGYKPWKDGYQIIWQELCVGRSAPGQDNVWIQLTDGGFANRDADWWVLAEQQIKPVAKPVTAEAVKDAFTPAPTTKPDDESTAPGPRPRPGRVPARSKPAK